MTKNTYPKPTRKPGRIDLVIKEFNNLIEDHGIYIRITPSIVCPRRTGEVEDESNINHDLNCPLCFGRGTVDLDSEAKEDWAFLQTIKLEQVFDSNSRFDIKDAFITTRTPVRLYYWYKIEIIDFGSQFNELILRGERDNDKDRLRYRAKDPEDGTIFSCIDGEGNIYEKDTDYTISGQEIVWGSNRPQKNKLYSFIYPVLPTFRVLELMHENRYYYDSFKKPVKSPEQLPQQAHIRWDFMAAGSGSDISAY